MSAAILGGLPVAAAAVFGVLAWAGRVALAVPRRPAGDRIDPFAVGEPWRRFVADALQAQARFDRTIRQSRAGPIKERLEAIARRIADGVGECWAIARQGDALEGAVGQLDVEGARRELAEVAEEQRRQRGDDGAQAALRRTEAAIEAQLASAERMERVASDARNRLRLLNAQLDEAVARSVELSMQTADVNALSPLTADVDTIVGELESLRQALEETSGTAGAAGTATA